MKKEDWDHLRTKQLKYNLYVNSFWGAFCGCQWQVCYSYYLKNSWLCHWKFSSKSKIFSILFLLHISVDWSPNTLHSQHDFHMITTPQTIPPPNRMSAHCMLIFCQILLFLAVSALKLDIFKTALMRLTDIQRTVHICTIWWLWIFATLPWKMFATWSRKS